jgi:microcystin degradation protein MlrC
VLIAGLSHESNGFVPGITPQSAFTVRRGAEMFACRGERSSLDGVVHGAEQLAWQLVPAIDMHAWPSAPAEDAAVDAFLHGVQAAADEFAADIHGVVFVMHGAMLTQSHADVEGLVLSRLRSLAGLSAIPIVAVFDLHGNISDSMVAALDAAVVYRRNPHDDIFEAGFRAAGILNRLMVSGRRGSCVLSRPGVLWPPSGTGTQDAPMKLLEDAARAIEKRDCEVLEAAVFAGFSYADHADVGVSMCVSTIGDSERARQYAGELAVLAHEQREAGDRRDSSLSEAISIIIHAAPGPVVVAEPSDNIGAGTVGDCTGLLRFLLEQDVGGICLLALCDPGAVARLQAQQIGGRHRIAIGGRGYVGDSGPVEREWEFMSRSTGVFSLEDPASPLAAFHGQTVDMGPCVVLRAGQVNVLVMSRPVGPWDLGQWRSQGLVPEQARVIAVKSAVAHRMAYRGIASAWVSVETPGPCPTDLSKIPYLHVRRPVYPLDRG